MNNIEQLANALRACGIEAEVSTHSVFCTDNKSHLCTFITTDFWTGEDNLEFVFHPKTGELVDSCLECPSVKK